MTTFETLHETLEQSQDSLSDYRQKAWEALNLPISRKEPFKYIDLSKLWEMPLHVKPPTDHPLDDHSILFSNGHFVKSTLPDDVVVLPLTQAMQTYGAFLKRRIKAERDPLALLSRSFMQEGVFIYVPPNCLLDRPVHIVEKNAEEALSCPQMFVRVGRRSSLKLVREGQQHVSLSYLDIALDEGAQLKFLQKSFGGWQFDAVRASLEKESSLLAYMLNEGQCTRADIRAELLGENASATLKGLSQLTGQKQAHQHLHVQHVAENTHSNQHFKTILKDEAKASFEGKIYVESTAQQTLAYQLNNNLLFGDKAIANSKPNLEIFADDVKASHGATMTRLDQDELFYLKSRGLSTEQAQSMLEKGFAEEILQEAQDVFGS